MSILLRPPLQARANSGLTFRPDASTVLWLPGQDDAYSSTIRDRSGNGNDGTITGATWTRLSSGLWVLDFDGSDDKIAITAASSIANIFDGGGTVIAWINTTTDGGGNLGRIFDKSKWQFYITDDDGSDAKINLFVDFDGAADGQWITTSLDIPLLEWVFVAVTYNSDNVANNPTICVNESAKTVGSGLNETSTPVGAKRSDSDDNLIIGGRASDNLRNFDGGIALERGINVILSATPLNTIYNQERHLFGV